MMDLHQQIFFTTLAVTFGILHFILFLYNRRLKSNLYFSIFLFFYSLNIFFDFQASLTEESQYAWVYIRIHRAVLPFNPIFMLLFSYSVFNLRIPRQFWFISLGLLITGVLAVYEPIDYFTFIQFFFIAVFIEACRIFISAIHHKKEGAILIGTGFMILFLFSLYDLLMDLGLIHPVLNITNGYPFGFIFLILSISIYLAQDFAKINQKILAQEIKAKELEINQRLLEAEDARKSRELEEARQIQLSMLPGCVPNLKGMDICFEMRTATEVGGDYYDFHIADDGLLTLAIGDATGHGMKAGLMVSIIKSLFITHAANMDILDFFEKVSWTIRHMKFNKLFMSMMLVKIKDGTLAASSAGMPALLIYRSKTKLIDEFRIKGMPLGAFESFKYQKIETHLEPGDTILLMSDGYPELFNDQDEILDDFRVKEIFKEIASKSSNEIVNHLFKTGDEWRKGRNLVDDVTFVVCKMT